MAVSKSLKGPGSKIPRSRKNSAAVPLGLPGPQDVLGRRAFFFKRYLRRVSVAMAFWRSFECQRFSLERLASPVLDVGCGDGFFAGTVFKGPLDTGIDMDGREVPLARKSGSYRQALLADVTSLPFRPGSFRTVVSNCVLEHVPDIEKGLREISRVLKPGGRLLMTVPSEHFNGAIHARAKGGWVSWAYLSGLNWVFKHHHVDSLPVWRGRLQRSGFRLQQAEEVMPIEAFWTYQKWLLPAFPSKISKMLTGRWVWGPRGWITSLAPRLFTRALSTEGGPGVIYFLAAVKK